MQRSYLAPIACCLAWTLCAETRDLLAVDYLSDIKPILAEKCFSCHGQLKQEANLRLDTRKLMVDGEAIVPGAPEKSELFARVSATDDTRMPPHGEGSSLKASEVDSLRHWIRSGAVAPNEITPQGPGEHWAFQKIRPPSLPRDSNRFKNDRSPIDDFLSEKRHEKSLGVTRPAMRSILLRRLYLDLIGLPPTARQLRDKRDWPTIVDELLCDPRHGERWARHWMDVWRYSDWYGLNKQLRYSQKHLWHWRDWIIESLNADKGYDRMIQEMLAGDELEPDNPDVIRATGFLARNYYLFNRTTWLDNTIEHTSKAFFGLTVNCAKCHDHKYDPITHVDYYNLRAVFEPHQVRLDPVPGIIDFDRDGVPRVFDEHTNLRTFLHLRGDPKNPDKETTITPSAPNFLADFQPRIAPVELPFQSYAPGARDYVQRDRLTLAERNLIAAKRSAKIAQDRFNASLTAEGERTQAENTDASDKPDARSLIEEFDQPNPSLWHIVGSNWRFRDGVLHQTISTREREFARLLRPLPSNFELSCEYTTTGGDIYKSVTVRFDQSADDKYANFVYTSAHADGPKIHVALTRDGKTTYPPQGRKEYPIQIGKRYKLRLAVRDTLVNVWLDDEFIIAYRLPDRNSDGFLSLSGFDATVGFDRITIRPLASNTVLTAAKNKTQTPLDPPETQLKLATGLLEIRQAEFNAIRATIAAQDAIYRTDTKEGKRTELARVAATRQAQVDMAKARHQELTAPDKAKLAIEKAAKRIAEAKNGDASFQPIRGSRKSLESPAHKETDYPPNYPQTSTGRRLALARWVTNEQHPLTARVAVNHIWMRHFGTPLVASVFDFGLRAPKPIHAELLDYLAYEFMRSGWSMRHLHRMIVLSEAYQMTAQSAGYQNEAASDPTNKYYWRFNTKRMESQVVRDSLLMLSGKLDMAVGGPSVDVNNKSSRRSVYFKHSRDDQDRFLQMFDDADLLQCYRRSESVVPQQALAMANSRLSIDSSVAIANRISTNHQDQDAFIAAAFRLLLARDPSADEIAQCDLFFRQMNKLSAPEADQAGKSRAAFVHALLNHNDFVSIR